MSYQNAGGSRQRTDFSGILVVAGVMILCFLGTLPVNAQVKVSPVKQVTPVLIYEQASPVANFTADFESGPAPLTVHFTDTSLNNPDSWLWDFNGDGRIDDQTRNPRHVYDLPGVYTVTLTVASKTGKGEVTKIGFITVEKQMPAPVADFTADPARGTTPLTVRFTDLSHYSPTTFEWDFNGDTITDSSEKDPVFTYTDPGVYSVQLTVRSTAGSDTISKKGYIIAEKPETIIETISATPSPADIISPTTSSPLPTSLPLTSRVLTTAPPSPPETKETYPFPALLIGIFIVAVLAIGGFILKRSGSSQGPSGKDLHIEMSGGIDYGDEVSTETDEKLDSPEETTLKNEHDDDLF